MTKQGPLTGLIAVDQKGVQPIGYVTWFSVPDRPVKRKHLGRVWVAAGLDEKVLPPEPRPLYLFKRAMRAQEGKVRNDDGTVTETDVKQVAEDSQYCIYQISRVVRDQQRRVVDYPKAMRVIFDKTTVNDPLDFQALEETPLKDIIPMREGIETYYDENGELIDGRKVRAIVRDYIKQTSHDAEEPNGTRGLSGTNLRGKGGGVYFVKAEYAEDLEALSTALNDLHKDESAYLYTVPLADGADARELIRRHHVANTVQELKEAMTDVDNLLRSDRKQRIRLDHATWHFERLKTLRQQAKEYADLLGEEQQSIEDEIEILEKKVDRLPGAVTA